MTISTLVEKRKHPKSDEPKTLKDFFFDLSKLSVKNEMTFKVIKYHFFVSLEIAASFFRGGASLGSGSKALNLGLSSSGPKYPEAWSGLL